MNNDTYHTITETSEGFYKDKGSKFYAFAIPAENEDQTKTILDDLKKTYYDARHHCYAYAIGLNRDIYRLNDDGEPSGTAARPIYGQILSNNLVNVMIVVIRYFGGTKLGVRGLINAYKYAAADALHNANIVEKKVKNVYELHYQYPQMNKVMYILKEENIEPLTTHFEVDCRLTFAVRKSQSEKIYDQFSRMYPLKITFLKTV